MKNLIRHILKEETNKSPLTEDVDKNKKFLTKLLGEDLIDSIQEITSAKQLPIEFLKSIGVSTLQQYIDVYGPLYYFVLDGEPYIYKDRGEYEMFTNNKGRGFFDGEIPDRLGLSVMGLKFSDVIDTIFNEEEPLNEDVDKNKKFLSNVMGVDFTGNIQQVTSVYDVPMEFDRNIPSAMVNRYLNKFGPMYLFELDGHRYLYLDVGDHEKFIDEKGNVFIENEIPERLGLDEIGLRFSNIIDLYFKEEEEDMITENKQNNPIDRVLKSHDITYDIKYGKRGFNNFKQYDSVIITFYVDRGNGPKPESIQPVYFFTEGNEIISEPIINGGFDWMFEVFEHIPEELLNNYFFDKAKTYLENYLNERSN